MLKALHKFLPIIKLTGTFRCVYVCAAKYGAYNCQLAVGVSAWGYNRFPYMRPLLKRQEYEIESATYDARTNNRNQWSTGAPQTPPVNIVLFADFQMLQVLNEIAWRYVIALCSYSSHMFRNLACLLPERPNSYCRYLLEKRVKTLFPRRRSPELHADL